MNILKGFWKWLDGKKSLTGLISFVLWIFIYAMPAFGEYNNLTHIGTVIRDFLLANNVHLDNSLFNIGSGLTVVGLIDKVRKFFTGERPYTVRQMRKSKLPPCNVNWKDLSEMQQRQLVELNQFLDPNEETNRSKS